VVSIPASSLVADAYQRSGLPSKNEGKHPRTVPGFAGQPLGALGCTPVNGLTAASTVNDAFNKAVSLINGSASGGSTTQSQIGLMNTLLGCINAEA
jgi:hypothetical protein